MLQKLSIQSRLLLLSGLLMLGLIGTTLYLTSTMSSNAKLVAQTTRLDQQIRAANEVRNSFGEYRYWISDMAVSLMVQSETNAGSARGRLTVQIEGLARSIRQQEQEVAQSRTANAAKLALLTQINKEVDLFTEAAKQALNAYSDQRRSTGSTYFAQAREHSTQVEQHLTELVDLLDKQVAEASTTMVESTEESTRFALIGVAAALAIGLVITSLVLRSILRPLDDIVTAMNGLTAGNLDTFIPAGGKDEIGTMANTLQLFRESLTERERLTRQAELQRQMIQTSLETISEGFALYDKHGRMLLCNSKFKVLYPGIADVVAPGITVEEMLQALVDRGLVHLGNATGDEWIAHHLRKPGTAGGLGDYRHKATWIRISERRTPDGGIVAVYSDVSELKLRQQELEAAMSKAETANLAKSSFLANMSHELRTPLNAIIGYSEILQEMAQDDGLNDYARDLVKIQSAGRHLLKLISDILDLSKIEAGKMELHLEDVELPSMVEEIRAIVMPLVVKNGNTLQIDCRSNIGHLYSDRTKLKQNLLNLLSNATKFTTGGVVKLTVERKVLASDSPVTFSVSDTGIGMTPEQMAKLFTPFAQADTSTTKRFGGTGLGLAITRHFCELLGGSVDVSSVAGQGSTFTMVMPSKIPVLPAATAQTGSATDTRTTVEEVIDVEDANAPLIMVVDDETDSRELMAIVLRKGGWRVVEADCGEQAIELARKLKPAGITLDLNMPRMDGWAVLTALKADPKLAEIPVIVVTVSADRGLALSLGASDFMTKPVDRMRLGTVLHRLIDDTSTILVVEDDKQSRDLIQRQMGQLNIKTFEAHNGREAIHWLSTNPMPSLILLDLMMPEMDGFLVLQHLRANPVWQKIPVVVVTAKDLSQQEREWLGEHARTIIAKGSSSARDLAAEVRQALREPAASGSVI